jgi:hypothetical protein
VSLRSGGRKTISLPIFQIGKPFPIPRDTHQARHFAVVALPGSLAARTSAGAQFDGCTLRQPRPHRVSLVGLSNPSQ